MALLLPFLLGVAGIAVDMGNMYLTHTRLQAAVDAGALAGSLELPYDPDLSMGVVNKAVTDMVAKNMEAAEVTDISAGTEIRSVNVTARAEVKMLLMEVLGMADSMVQASAMAGFNKLEVVFVIDNSGSMKGTPISMVKLASNELTDLLIPDGTTPDTKVGLVPFRGKIRLGEDVDGYSAGCVNSDGSPNHGIHEDFMDDYYALPYYYRNYISLDTCSNIPPVLPLSKDKYKIVSAIDSQTATGAASGTVIPEGIKWGRNILTPTPPFTQA
ncbi:MAG TPA: pilus assembly protein, partial [Pseudodesulfovibrio sp.]|nr:pilus assembly protein [Pseudodesulfovibrio sp.]